MSNIPKYIAEFEEFIKTKNYNFVGREFVFSAINNFINQYDRGYFTIIGEPGIGKSAILAHYVSHNSGVVYYNVEISGKNSTEEFLTTICTQLIEISKNKVSNDSTADFPVFTTEGSSYLSLLLQQISDRLHPEQRLIITIDGCDRIDINNHPRGSNIFYLPRYLPQNLKSGCSQKVNIEPQKVSFEVFCLKFETCKACESCTALLCKLT